MNARPGHRILALPVPSLYPLYQEDVGKKGRTQGELNAVICWLTGFDESELRRRLAAARPWQTSSQGRGWTPMLYR